MLYDYVLVVLFIFSNRKYIKYKGLQNHEIILSTVSLSAAVFLIIIVIIICSQWLSIYYKMQRFLYRSKKPSLLAIIRIFVFIPHLSKHISLIRRRLESAFVFFPVWHSFIYKPASIKAENICIFSFGNIYILIYTQNSITNKKLCVIDSNWEKNSVFFHGVTVSRSTTFQGRIHTQE